MHITFGDIFGIGGGDTFRIGVEWIKKYQQSPDPCKRPPDLRYSEDVAVSFLAAMNAFGHHEVVFNWGNDNAWPSDFEHPDFGGDSLNWSDNVHFCYYTGHGRNHQHAGKGVQLLGFSSNHTSPSSPVPCCTLSAQWRLGVKQLKWFVIDSCVMVQNTDPNHVVEVWGGPMQGIHLVLGFIDLNRVGPNAYNQRVLFAFDICRGRALANAWLDTAFWWENPNDPLTHPIAIAAGASRDEAINRREYETLDWAIFDVASTNWLAWKWRG